jgi:hypothetical protein
MSTHNSDIFAELSAGFSFVSVLQALNAPIPTMATAPAASANCRVKDDRMMNFLLSVPRRA